jgi:hypothetical protein
MQVRVLKAGNNKPAMQVNYGGVGRGQGPDLGIGADGEQVVAANCQSLRIGMDIIPGPDKAVYKDTVGMLPR